MVFSSFRWFGLASGNNAYPVFSLCVGDKQQTVFDHTKQRNSWFCSVLRVVQPLDGKRVARHFESDTVRLPVARRFCVVPFEFAVTH